MSLRCALGWHDHSRGPYRTFFNGMMAVYKCSRCEHTSSVVVKSKS